MGGKAGSCCSSASIPYQRSGHSSNCLPPPHHLCTPYCPAASPPSAISLHLHAASACPSPFLLCHLSPMPLLHGSRLHPWCSLGCNSAAARLQLSIQPIWQLSGLAWGCFQCPRLQQGWSLPVQSKVKEGGRVEQMLGGGRWKRAGRGAVRGGKGQVQTEGKLLDLPIPPSHLQRWCGDELKMTLQ